MLIHGYDVKELLKALAKAAIEGAKDALMEPVRKRKKKRDRSGGER